ncbi:unnamed protein product [Pleuronectes platessa]|uniref:Promethin n=1 Tax=Pleuronectes platessa TaxID=8262 RepID=A0A9N7YF94_PLEPL|nr:unnamed protein product [Pleuronectes platessa]
MQDSRKGVNPNLAHVLNGFLLCSGHSVEMQPSTSGSDSQQQQGRWTALLSRCQSCQNSEMAQVMKTKFVQYMSSHPFLTLTVMVFGAMAALPVGLFLGFALVTAGISAVGFVFFEVSLLFVAGLTLLCILIGLAFFSVTVSLILMAFQVSIANVLKYSPQLIKPFNVQEKETDSKIQD